MYYIQSRWKLEGRKLCYYGLRSGENMFRNSVPVSKETLIKSNSPRSNPHTHAAEFDTLRFNQRVPKRQARIISDLPKELTEDEKKMYRRSSWSAGGL